MYLQFTETRHTVPDAVSFSYTVARHVFGFPWDAVGSPKFEGLL